MDEFSVTGDCNTPLTERGRFSRRVISKDVVDPNSTISHLDLINIDRMLQATTEFTFFSSSHGTFTKTDHSRPQNTP